MAFLPFGFQPLRKNVKSVVPVKFRQIGKPIHFFKLNYKSIKVGTAFTRGIIWPNVAENLWTLTTIGERSSDVTPSRSFFP